MANQTSGNTAQFAYQPLTQGGFPSIVDDNFRTAMQTAVQGGEATQTYFDATNQTSDFWNAVGSNTIRFANGTDPNGNPIVMASTGNVNMRLGAFYADPATNPAAPAGADTPAAPPVVGIATVQTMNTTSNVSKDMSFGLQMLSVPGGLVLTKALFGDLISPLYSNFKTFLQNMAETYQKAAQVEDPSIDPLEENEDVLSDASAEVQEVGGDLAEQGAEYMAVDWGSVGLEAAGLGALVAIPMVISLLGHRLINSVSIVNETDLSFTWSIDQVEGSASVLPTASSNNVIPALSYVKDAWGDVTSVQCAYDANFQFINSSDLGSIGYVITLTPSGGGTPARIVVSIPWGVGNAIWVGQSDADPQTIYDTNSAANGQLAVSATFGDYQVSVAINALLGETSGENFYGVVAHITPASA